MARNRSGIKVQPGPRSRTTAAERAAVAAKRSEADAAAKQNNQKSPQTKPQEPQTIPPPITPPAVPKTVTDLLLESDDSGQALSAVADLSDVGLLQLLVQSVDAHTLLGVHYGSKAVPARLCAKLRAVMEQRNLVKGVWDTSTQVTAPGMLHGIVVLSYVRPMFDEASLDCLAAVFHIPWLVDPPAIEAYGVKYGAKRGRLAKCIVGALLLVLGRKVTEGRKWRFPSHPLGELDKALGWAEAFQPIFGDLKGLLARVPEAIKLTAAEGKGEADIMVGLTPMPPPAPTRLIVPLQRPADAKDPKRSRAAAKAEVEAYLKKHGKAEVFGDDDSDDEKKKKGKPGKKKGKKGRMDHMKEVRARTRDRQRRKKGQIREMRKHNPNAGAIVQRKGRGKMPSKKKHW